MATVPSTTVKFDRYAEALDANEGYCTTCRDFTRQATHPEALSETCPTCGQRTVYGAAAVVMDGYIEVEP